MAAEPQNYKNHARFVPAYHFVLLPLLILGLGFSVLGLYHSLGDHRQFHTAALLLLLMLSTLMTAFFARLFSLKAQDRAIRAEENLRHYVLTGKLLDPRLSCLQIVGLRFAPDDEFPALAARAAAENMAQKDIKLAVKNWRADEYRV